MPEQLRSILPHILNVALALGTLFVAYLLTIPLRRRYASGDSVELARRSGRQFLGVLSSYPAFSVVVLVLSLPVIHWLYRPQERPYDQAWLLFWGIYAVVRLAEGLVVELFAQMGRTCPSADLPGGCCVWWS